MPLAQARYINMVLVTKLSYWGHNTLDLLETLRDLEARRVSMIALGGMAFDLSNAAGRTMTTVLAGIAEFERHLLREQVRSGLAAAKAAGNRARISGATSRSTATTIRSRSVMFST